MKVVLWVTILLPYWIAFHSGSGYASLLSFEFLAWMGLFAIASVQVCQTYVTFFLSSCHAPLAVSAFLSSICFVCVFERVQKKSLMTRIILVAQLPSERDQPAVLVLL